MAFGAYFDAVEVRCYSVACPAGTHASGGCCCILQHMQNGVHACTFKHLHATPLTCTNAHAHAPPTHTCACMHEARSHACTERPHHAHTLHAHAPGQALCPAREALSVLSSVGGLGTRNFKVIPRSGSDWDVLLANLVVQVQDLKQLVRSGSKRRAGGSGSSSSGSGGNNAAGADQGGPIDAACAGGGSGSGSGASSSGQGLEGPGGMPEAAGGMDSQLQGCEGTGGGMVVRITEGEEREALGAIGTTVDVFMNK